VTVELLRRSLLLGCILPGLWLLRLTPLEPLVTIALAETPPGMQGLEVQRGSGPGWDALMEDVEALAKGEVPRRVEDRVTSFPSGPDGTRFNLFVRASDEAIGRALWNRVAASGTSYVSASRPGGGARYRMDLHTWTRSDFRPGAGFTGQPRPPSSLLYPLRLFGAALLLAGVLFFVALPSPTRAEGPLSLIELLPLAGAAVFFSAPLFAVGGSVQALTTAAWLTIPCWIVAAGCMHLFAKPVRNVPHLFEAAGDSEALSDALQHPAFVRIGAAFLAVAVGPVAVMVAASMALWNR
jgi:hypothetical protein